MKYTLTEEKKISEIFNDARNEVLSHDGKPMRCYEVIKVIDDMAGKIETLLVECEEDSEVQRDDKSGSKNGKNQE